METIVLDPSEVSTGRTELNLSALNLVRADPGIDWGDAAIEAFMADRERGSAPVDFRIPNRQISIPLVIKQIGTTSFHQTRLLLQQKVARFQQEGGWIRRTTTANTTVFADVVNASLHLGGSWLSANKNVDIDAELRLEVLPDWYGDERVLADHVETVQGEIVWTESNVAGDYPGRVRVVVDDDQGQSQQGLMWGVRCRHYSNSTTAQLKYEAETCTPMDLASQSGSYIRHFLLATSWTAVMSTDQTPGATALTHTGTYKVWARMYSESVAGYPNKVPPSVRLVWDVGDFALPSENDPVDMPGLDQWFAVDLGEVRLDRVPAGTHRWRGVIQGRDPDGVGVLRVDKIWLVPVDEGYGVLRAPVNSDPGLSSYLARDEFLLSGVLTGKSASVGGTWQGAGDSDDFVYNGLTQTLQRTSVSDTASGAVPGRVGFLAVGAAAVVVQVDTVVTDTSTQFQSGVVARWANTSNFLASYLRLGQLAVVMVASGITTTLGSVSVSRKANVVYQLRLAVDTSGRWFVWWGLRGGTLKLVATGQRTELATGGALASGGVGIWDANTFSTAGTRTYDNFAAWPFTQDAVLFASQSAELRTEGMFREDPTGTAFGPVSWVSGDLPRIPPSGAEGRTVQFFVKASRGDLLRLPDSSQDDISARVTYRPSWLFVQ